MDDQPPEVSPGTKRPLQFGMAGALGSITAIAVLIGTLRALQFDVLALLVLLGVFAVAMAAGLAVIYVARFADDEGDAPKEERTREQG